MKKLFKYLLYFIGFYLVFFLCAPFAGGSLTDYAEPFYWLKILLLETVFLGPLFYLDLVPRKHVTIYFRRTKQQKTLWIGGIILSLTTLATLMLIIAYTSDNAPIKPFLIALWLLSLPILFRVLFFRGISFYKNKKIKIFKLRTTAYQNAVIDDITVTELEKSAQINVVINGQDNGFTVLNLAEAYAYKSMIQQAMDAVKKKEFKSFFDKKDS